MKGRPKTGLRTISEVPSLNVTELVNSLKDSADKRYSGQGKPLPELLTASRQGLLNGDEAVSISIELGSEGGRVLLTHNLHKGNEVTNSITLTPTPSNLGVGLVWFFVCPWSGKKCRTLYHAYSSGMFQSREAYKGRYGYPLNYDSQVQCKTNYHCSRFWHYSEKIDSLYGKRKTYKGRSNLNAQKVEGWTERMKSADKKRREPHRIPAKVMPLLSPSFMGL